MDKNKIMIVLVVLVLICAVVIGIGQFNKYKINLMNQGAQIQTINIINSVAQCQTIPVQLADGSKITLVALECLQQSE